MKILFLHGLEGGVNGRKITFLRDKGYEVVAPQLLKEDYDESVEIAKRNLEGVGIIVGASRGGAIAMDLETGIPKVLIAPAWKRFSKSPRVNAGDVIIHSLKDDVIPYTDSTELKNGKLITVGVDHRMSDDDALESLAREVEIIVTAKGDDA